MGLSAKAVAGTVATALALIALVAGIADWRHRKRHDLDSVSLLDWRNIQVFSLIGAIVAAAVAFQL